MDPTKKSPTKKQIMQKTLQATNDIDTPNVEEMDDIDIFVQRTGSLHQKSVIQGTGSKLQVEHHHMTQVPRQTMNSFNSNVS